MAMLLLSCPVPAQQVNFTLDFEEGNLRGWIPTGDAFRHQPTLNDNPTARKRGQRSNHQGRYWIGTYERYQGSRGQEPGDIQGDQPTGTLTSNYFVVPSGTLTFLIGGGSSVQTRVELYSQDPDATGLPFASGNDTETMSRVTWDLTRHAGQRMQIRIVDNSSGSWGHINVDDFRFIPARRRLEQPEIPGAKIEERISPPESLEIQITPSYLELSQGEIAEFQSSLSAAGARVQQSWIGPGNQSASGAEFRIATQGITPGTYRILLTVTDSRGAISRAPATLVVNPPAAPEYELQAAVRPRRIRVGDSVTIIANLIPADDNTEYRFDFGDESSSSWTRQPEITHVYESPGVFYIGVTARRARTAARLTRSREEPILAVSERIDVVVEDPLQDIEVFLRPNRDTVYLNDEIIFSLVANRPLNNARYSFFFGDSQSSGDISSNRTSHAYSTEGLFRAFGLVTVGRRVFRSEAVPIQVRARPDFEEVEYRADLRLSRNQSPPAEDIQFFADLDPSLENPQFNFLFGDGEESGWMSVGQTSHRYSEEGFFDARVIVMQDERILAQSPEERVYITEDRGSSEFPISVFIHADPDFAETGEAIDFVARIEPANQEAEYRFFFGDGTQTEWSQSAEARHSYTQPETYSAYVTARVGQGPVVESAQISIVIASARTKGNLLKILLILAAAIGIAGIVRFLLRPIKIPKIVPHMDSGVQSIGSKHTLDMKHEIQLRLFPDQGSQKIELNPQILNETIKEEEI